MTCYLHTDQPATAFCRSCGRPLCIHCQRPAEGTVFCQEHVPGPYHAEAAYSAPQEPFAGPTVGAPPPNPYYASFPPPPPPRTHSSPVLASVLGFIPGVGAIYNGQYLKGLVHASIIGLLLSMADAAENTPGQPLLVMIMIAFWCYMVFEAYHTAKKRQLGQPVEEWSSLLGPAPHTGSLPIGPIILIGIGIVFLLDTLHVIEFREFGRFWPVILIMLGAYLLYSRLTAHPRVPPAPYLASQPYPSAAAPPPNPNASADAMEDRP